MLRVKLLHEKCWFVYIYIYIYDLYAGMCSQVTVMCPSYCNLHLTNLNATALQYSRVVVSEAMTSHRLSLNPQPFTSHVTFNKKHVSTSVYLSVGCNDSTSFVLFLGESASESARRIRAEGDDPCSPGGDRLRAGQPEVRRGIPRAL